MIEVNLLPDSQKSGRRARQPSAASRLRGISLGKDPWNVALIVALVIVPLAIVGLWLSQRAEARGLDERLAEASADSTRLADLRAVSDSLVARQALIRERVALISRLDRGRFVWPHLMDEVGRALPPFAWLTSLEQVAPPPDVSVEIQGMAANPLTITEFVRQLEASPYIGEVRILGSQRQELEELAVQSFTLVAGYAQPPDSEATAPIVETGGP